MENITDTKKPRSFFVKLLINLAAMAVVGFLLVIGVLYWLDSWTAHGHVSRVPDVKGLTYTEALTQLRDNGFDVELTDSVYNRHARPGVVVEQNPKVNSKVKPGRTIYLTINAFQPKHVTLPTIRDVSLRQARSILEGLGIENIREVRVHSEFRDLVLGVKLNGRELSAGARVPVTSTITLEIGSGLSDDTLTNDELSVSSELDSADDDTDLELL